MRPVEPGTGAVTLLERATGMHEQHHGPAGPEVITDLRCLAAALTEAGRFADAIVPLERVLAADAANAGALAEKLLPTLTSLADAFLASGDPARALPHLERVVAITERVWGPNDLRQVAASRKLADVMAACNLGWEVIPVLERVAALHDYYGAETGEVVNDLRKLAAALLQQKRSQDAQRYLEQAQDIERRHTDDAR
jgi:tetratricopeptide (TPR) repeat protein